MRIKDFSRKEKAWITWEKQRRNSSMAEALNTEFHELNSSKGLLGRYIELSIKTLKIIKQNNPKLIFIQNPSIALALLGVVIRKLKAVTVVMDAHNAGIFPAEGRSQFLNFIAKYIFKNVSYTIVTNPSLANYVNKHNGNAIVAPDPLPTFHLTDIPSPSKETIEALFICTWAEDEPYLETIAAAELLQQQGVKININFTGRSKGKENSFGKPIPENVHLLGFVEESKYIELLHTSDIIIDLTSRENCLVCGAYEAVAAETPLILSNTKALQDYFYKGTIHCKNTPEEIAKGIKTALSKLDELNIEISTLKKELTSKHVHYIESINNLQIEGS